jgi:hypothetical protein
LLEIGDFRWDFSKERRQPQISILHSQNCILRKILVAEIDHKPIVPSRIRIRGTIASLARTVDDTYKQAGENPFGQGYAIVDPDMLERVARDA